VRDKCKYCAYELDKFSHSYINSWVCRIMYCVSSASFALYIFVQHCFRQAVVLVLAWVVRISWGLIELCNKYKILKNSGQEVFTIGLGCVVGEVVETLPSWLFHEVYKMFRKQFCCPFRIMTSYSDILFLKNLHFVLGNVCTRWCWWVQSVVVH
jgi:hypothetical protein